MDEGQLNPDVGYGTLTVNGLDMFCGAWCITDMSAMLDDAELRGGNRLIPMAPGTLARRRRRTTTRKDFPVVVTGKYTQAGALLGETFASWQAGLTVNLRALRAGLGIANDAPAGVTGTVEAVWTPPGETAMTADVHVLAPLRVQIRSYAALAVLSLEVPVGVFA
jgi:hypothetical protein